jgi:2-polyprenyl-3-methyl-5-hydroxy-6-metoxy-1,4-benzoquinol methylase
MLTKTIKRRIRRIAHRLGIMQDWEQRLTPEGREQPAEWYDKVYNEAAWYRDHYTKSCYYALWSIIVDRIVGSGARRVLDIGCGPGQFASYLYDQGIRHYVGLDFSAAAVEMGCRKELGFEFVQGDARSSDVYDRVDYDVLVCTEVLEHVEEDLIVVSRFRPGRRCLCTVPNFPWTSHVRHFRSAEEVHERYGPFFRDLKVLTFKGTRDDNEEFFLLDGVRNDKVVGG